MENNRESVSLGNLLARLDERTQSIQTNMKDIRNDVKTFSDGINLKLDEQQEKIDTLRKHNADSERQIRHDFDTEIKSIKKDFESNYVKKESYMPVQRIVYGLVGLVLTIVCTALFGLVVTK